ncbi:MAG: hypothetical protein PHI97_06165 [Desulfobulbus sp.]|nr:hypothetical protein [Desulfobulbus sp.]
MNEFLNPKSMLTPGVAGSLMMFLVNGIGCQFPELPMRYAALFLSFLIGSVVWFSELEGRAPMVQKGIYWVLNSLVIFVVGFGTANLAADATAGAPSKPPQALNLFAPASAYADQSTPPTTTTALAPSQVEIQDLTDKLARERAKNDQLKQELEASQQHNPQPPPPPPSPENNPQQQNFFKRW